MQDIREIEFRDSGSNAIPRYVLRFEPLLCVPAFIQKDFHYVHTGLPQRDLNREIITQHQEYKTPLSNTVTFTQEGGTKSK